MRPLYDEQKAENYWFAIYHLYYKENPKMTESTHYLFFFQLPPNKSATKITLSIWWLKNYQIWY